MRDSRVDKSARDPPGPPNSANRSEPRLQEPIRCVVRFALTFAHQQEGHMDSIIYLVGLVVVIMAILSFLGLR